MNKLKESIINRHSVRAYSDKHIEDAKVAELQDIILKYNAASGLNMQLITDEPEAFNCFLAHYGKFRGVRNYVAMVGPKDQKEACGYYGERIVLAAQAMGLNTCWVGLSYKKVKQRYTIGNDEKLHLLIAIGYGTSQGVSHRSKSVADVTICKEEMPDWFKAGVEAALLAPTAMNQQKFRFELIGTKVKATTFPGFYTKIDLGIAKCHFEIGAEVDKSIWL